MAGWWNHLFWEIERFPIILPKGHGFVTSLILKTHLINQHAPIDWIHFYLRQQYWIMSSRLQIKSVVRKCLECQKANARRVQQIMAPLPKIRLKFAPPFSKVGVDYTAKFQVKMTQRAKVTHPCYIVYFYLPNFIEPSTLNWYFLVKQKIFCWP